MVRLFCQRLVNNLTVKPSNNEFHIRMTKNILQQILIRAIIVSPIIAALSLTPFAIVYSLAIGMFLVLWIMLTLGTLFWWGVQTLLFSYFKRKKKANWQYGIVLTIIILVFVFLTKDSAGKVATSLDSYTVAIAFLLRFTIVSGINIIIYLLLDLIFTRAEGIQLVKENAALTYQNLETAYKLLKEQINPHFLFNALNISKSLIKTQPKNAEKYILHLSEFLRKTFKNEHKSITLQEELDHCLQFVELQKVRFKNTIQIDLQIADKYRQKRLPFFALVTLVENAIKHNAFNEATPLKIALWIEEDYLLVKNNIRAKKGVISTKTGLNNLNQRSLLVANCPIDIEQNEHFFKVKIKLI